MFIGGILIGKPEISPIYWIIKIKDGNFKEIKENAGSLLFSFAVSLLGYKLYSKISRKLGGPSVSSAVRSLCPVESFLPSFLFSRFYNQKRISLSDNQQKSSCPLGYGKAFQSAASSSTQSKGCPLGFGAGAKPGDSTTSLPELPLCVLHGHLELVSVKGIIFDFSALEKSDWKPFDAEGDPRQKLFRGHEISRALATASCSSEHLDQGLSGLCFDELQQLEGWFKLFQAKLPAVGRLAALDYEKMFGHSRDANLNAEKSNDIHAAIEAEDVGSVRTFLAAAEDKITVANTICPRTQLSALHKAVEAGNFEIVQILVDSGASLKCQANLYEGETPFQLSKRFQLEEISNFLEKCESLQPNSAKI